ncbi:uncharacterized protein V6R79_016356 [Siganus canaliculatus]
MSCATPTHCAVETPTARKFHTRAPPLRRRALRAAGRKQNLANGQEPAPEFTDPTEKPFFGSFSWTLYLRRGSSRPQIEVDQCFLLNVISVALQSLCFVKPWLSSIYHPGNQYVMTDVRATKADSW